MITAEEQNKIKMIIEMYDECKLLNIEAVRYVKTYIEFLLQQEENREYKADFKIIKQGV